MKYFIVNTNRKADPNGHDEEIMLNEEIVALYFDGYKEKIEKLSDGDVVFLYSNAHGIIAYGEVTGKTCVRNYKGMTKFKGQEYFRHLKSFVILDQPISAKEIKQIVGQQQAFLKAFFEMDEKFAIPLSNHLSNLSRRLKVA